MEPAWNYAEVVLGGQGWHFYNLFFDIFSTLGVHYYAFAIVMLATYFDIKKQGYAIPAHYEIKIYFIRTITFFIVVFLFWMPSNYAKYSTQKLIDSERFDSVPVAFDNLDGDYPTPLGIGLTHKLLKALTHQMNNSSLLDMRATEAFMTQNLMKIENPKTQVETAYFIEQCYRPALHRLSIVNNFEDDYDGLPTYIGDELLMQPGIYKKCHQTESDSGNCLGSADRMPVELAEKLNIQTKHLVSSEDGSSFYATVTPSCYTWWTGNEDHYYDHSGIPGDYIALREQLYAEAKKHFNRTWALSKNAEDEYIQRLLFNSDMLERTTPDTTSEKHIGGKIKDWVVTSFASAGAKIFEVILAFTLKALTYALPIIHGFLVFGFLAFASFAIPMSGFSLSYSMSMLLHFLYIMLLPVVWNIAGLMNDAVLRLLYPNNFESDTVLFISMDVNTGMATTIVSILSGLLYIWLPLYLRSVFSSLGDKVADATDSLISESQKAGKTGGGALISKMGSKGKK
ncbi:MAG: conjugal transfer protein TraG N-terminal domain-containing protein [Methyloprofundus sp.]|nr:conjugal transfer protein TraG N-terminal domain-containing protein [Methyloprofundus sp.]